MKTLIKVISILIFSFALAQTPPAPPAEADDYNIQVLPPPPAPNPPKISKEERLEKLSILLDLTPEQIAKIEEIDHSFEAEEEDIDSQMEALKERKRAIRKEKKSEIDKVLTADQKEKLKQLRSTKRKRPEGRRGVK